MNKQSINPVSIPAMLGGAASRVAINRIHVGDKKILAIAVYEDRGEEKVYASTFHDEDVFIDALGHLFNRGELANTHHQHKTVYERTLTPDETRETHLLMAAAHLWSASSGRPVHKFRDQPEAVVESWISAVATVKP